MANQVGSPLPAPKLMPDRRPTGGAAGRCAALGRSLTACCLAAAVLARWGAADGAGEGLALHGRVGSGDRRLGQMRAEAGDICALLRVGCEGKAADAVFGNAECDDARCAVRSVTVIVGVDWRRVYGVAAREWRTVYTDAVSGDSALSRAGCEGGTAGAVFGSAECDDACCAMHSVAVQVDVDRCCVGARLSAEAWVGNDSSGRIMWRRCVLYGVYDDCGIAGRLNAFYVWSHAGALDAPERCLTAHPVRCQVEINAGGWLRCDGDAAGLRRAAPCSVAGGWDACSDLLVLSSWSGGWSSEEIRALGGEGVRVMDGCGVISRVTVRGALRELGVSRVGSGGHSRWRAGEGWCVRGWRVVSRGCSCVVSRSAVRRASAILGGGCTVYDRSTYGGFAVGYVSVGGVVFCGRICVVSGLIVCGVHAAPYSGGTVYDGSAYGGPAVGCVSVMLCNGTTDMYWSLCLGALVYGGPDARCVVVTLCDGRGVTMSVRCHIRAGVYVDACEAVCVCSDGSLPACLGRMAVRAPMRGGSAARRVAATLCDVRGVMLSVYWHVRARVQGDGCEFVCVCPECVAFAVGRVSNGGVVLCGCTGVVSGLVGGVPATPRGGSAAYDSSAYGGPTAGCVPAMLCDGTMGMYWSLRPRALMYGGPDVGHVVVTLCDSGGVTMTAHWHIRVYVYADSCEAACACPVRSLLACFGRRAVRALMRGGSAAGCVAAMLCDARGAMLSEYWHARHVRAGVYGDGCESVCARSDVFTLACPKWRVVCYWSAVEPWRELGCIVCGSYWHERLGASDAGCESCEFGCVCANVSLPVSSMQRVIELHSLPRTYLGLVRCVRYMWVFRNSGKCFRLYLGLQTGVVTPGIWGVIDETDDACVCGTDEIDALSGLRQDIVDVLEAYTLEAPDVYINSDRKQRNALTSETFADEIDDSHAYSMDDADIIYGLRRDVVFHAAETPVLSETYTLETPVVYMYKDRRRGTEPGVLTPEAFVVRMCSDKGRGIHIAWALRGYWQSVGMDVCGWGWVILVWVVRYSRGGWMRSKVGGCGRSSTGRRRRRLSVRRRCWPAWYGAWLLACRKPSMPHSARRAQLRGVRRRLKKRPCGTRRLVFPYPARRVRNGSSAQTGGRGVHAVLPNCEPWDCVREQVGEVREAWPDGSCFLWAVAVAMGRVTGVGMPTERELQLEREWRRGAAEVMSGWPSVEARARANSLREGSVVYTGDGHARKRTKAGEWGGPEELSALSTYLGVTIVIWNVTCQVPIVCEPGRMYRWPDRMETAAWAQRREGRVHVVYNGINHYDALLPRVSTGGAMAGGLTVASAVEPEDVQVASPADSVGRPRVRGVETLEDSGVKHEELGVAMSDKARRGASGVKHEEPGVAMGDMARRGASDESGRVQKQQSMVEGECGEKVKCRTERCVLASLNINGVMVHSRSRADIKANPSCMRWYASAKLQEVVGTILANKIDVMVLVDAHAREHFAKRYQEAVSEQSSQLQVRVVERIHTRLGGFVIIWNAKRWEVQDEEVVEGGRIVQFSVQQVETDRTVGGRWNVLAVYMPVRRVESTPEEMRVWQVLRDRLSRLRAEVTPVYVIGDLNAEPMGWIEKKGGRMHASDEALQELCQDFDCTPLIHNEATHAKGSLIDNVLVPGECTAGVRTAFTLPGVSEGDHRMVVAELDWGKSSESYERPVGSYAHAMEGESLRVYRELLEGVHMGAGMTPAARWRWWQSKMTGAAAAAMHRDTWASRVQPVLTPGEGAASRVQQVRRQMRGKVAKWARLLAQAFKWSGALSRRWRHTGVYAATKGNEAVAGAVTNAARRRAAILHCEEAKEAAEQELRGMEGGAQQRGDRLVEALYEACDGMGHAVIKIYDALHAARGGDRAGGRVAAVYKGDNVGAEVVRGDRLKQEVYDIACKRHARTAVDEGAVQRLLEYVRAGPSGDGLEEHGGESRRDFFSRVFSDERGLEVIWKWQKRKGMGVDAFDVYLVKQAPEWVQREYVRALREILISEDYPEEWNEWIALLFQKPGEDPWELGRRRDIWLQCHGLKVVMRVLQPEYQRVGARHVPDSQAGFEKGRSAAEHVLTARAIIERCEVEQIAHARAYVDLGQYFMSVPHATQWLLEKEFGVNEHVVSTLQALREGKDKLPPLRGRYETAEGLTQPVPIEQGLGQGDILSPDRARLTMAVLQRVLMRLHPGVSLDGVARGTPFLVYADDGMLIADSPNTLQTAMDILWTVASIMGLNLIVKGNKKKTAWAAVRYVDGAPRDVVGWRLQLPDGREVPQLIGDETYKYLGSELPTAWCGRRTHAEVRRKVVERCGNLIKDLGQLRLPLEVLATAIELGIAGTLGSYGRSSVITYEDCVMIEAKRAEVLRGQTVVVAVPRGVLYCAPRAGGLGMGHAYGYAAAALIDEVDRALSGPVTRPVHQAVARLMAVTAYKLGCRGVSPLEWQPQHVMEHLRDDMLIEAYYKARLRCGLGARLTSADVHPALSKEAWTTTRAAAPSLWEGGEVSDGESTWTMPPIPFLREVAAWGVVSWADVTSYDGEPRRLKDLRASYPARWSDRGKRAVHNLRAYIGRLRDEEWWPRWKRARGAWGRVESPPECGGNLGPCELRAWREAPAMVGGREYKVCRGKTGVATWEDEISLLGRSNATVRRAVGRIREDKSRRVAACFYEYTGGVSRRCLGVAVWQQLLEFVEQHAVGEVAPAWQPRVPARVERERHPTLYAGGPKGSLGHIPRVQEEILRGAAGRRVHVQKKNARRQPKRQFSEEPYGREELEPLPELPAGWAVHTGQVEGFSPFRDKFDASRDEEVMSDAVLRLFARVLEVESDEVTVGEARQRLNIDRMARAQLSEGAELNRQVMQLALKLHTRVGFTDAAATDGSKLTRIAQEYARDGGDGCTSYGVWEGVRHRQPATLLARRIRVQRGISSRELREAASKAVIGGRVGDGATVMEAELFAIYAYLARVQLRPDAANRRVLVMSDCLGGLQAIEQTWRGAGNSYRKREGGAMLEAINAVRERLGAVVFVWVPAHKGVVPNMYADAVAKAYLSDAAPKSTLRVLAREVRTRAVLYGRCVAGHMQVIGQPIFRAARRAAGWWVRNKMLWGPCAPLGGERREWNEQVLTRAGHARLIKPRRRHVEEELGEEEPPQPPTPDEVAVHRQITRVVIGLRQGQVAGGPQCERTMRHAAHSRSDTFASYAIASGCRACDTRGREEVPQETTEHAYLRCTAATGVGSYRASMAHTIAQLIRIYAGKGEEGGKAVGFLRSAVRALYANGTTDEWQALRWLVSGCVPEWSAMCDKRVRELKRMYDKQVVAHIKDMQMLCVNRLRTWLRAASSRRSRQQSKWDRREWLRLILRAWRESVPVSREVCGDARDMSRWSRAERGKACCIGAVVKYVRLIVARLRLEMKVAQERERRRVHARARLRYWLRRAMRAAKDERVLSERAVQRGEHVVARTRQACMVQRINYAEHSMRRVRVGELDVYNMRKWGWREQVGARVVEAVTGVMRASVSTVCGAPRTGEEGFLRAEGAVVPTAARADGQSGQQREPLNVTDVDRINGNMANSGQKRGRDVMDVIGSDRINENVVAQRQKRSRCTGLSEGAGTVIGKRALREEYNEATIATRVKKRRTLGTMAGAL